MVRRTYFTCSGRFPQDCGHRVLMEHYHMDSKYRAKWVSTLEWMNSLQTESQRWWQTRCLIAFEVLRFCLFFCIKLKHNTRFLKNILWLISIGVLVCPSSGQDHCVRATTWTSWKLWHANLTTGRQHIQDIPLSLWQKAVLILFHTGNKKRVVHELMQAGFWGCS